MRNLHLIFAPRGRAPFGQRQNSDPWVPFLERPGKLTGPKSYFEIKFSRKVGCVLTSNEAHFVSLPNNFTVPFSKLEKLSSLMENKTVFLHGPGNYRELRETGRSNIGQIWLAENTKRIICACSKNQIRPEFTILAAVQKEHGHWGRECLDLTPVTFDRLRRVVTNRCNNQQPVSGASLAIWINVRYYAGQLVEKSICNDSQNKVGFSGYVCAKWILFVRKLKLFHFKLNRAHSRRHFESLWSRAKLPFN